MDYKKIASYYHYYVTNPKSFLTNVEEIDNIEFLVNHKVPSMPSPFFKELIYRVYKGICSFYGISYRTYFKLQKVASMTSFLPSFFHRTDLRTISSTIAHSMLDDLSIQQQQQTTTNQGASLSRIDDNFTSTSSSLASASANASGKGQIISEFIFLMS